MPLTNTAVISRPTQPIQALDLRLHGHPADQVASAAAMKTASSAGVPRSLVPLDLPCYSRAIMATASFSRSMNGSPETSTIALRMVPPVNGNG